MKKCKIIKEISIGDNKIERETNFIQPDKLTFFSNKKLTIPIYPSLNTKILLTNKKNQKRKNFTNILINDNNTISNISLSNNSNIIFNDANNLYKSKIYQKKRIPIPQKGSNSKDKVNCITLGIKKALNISNRTDEKNAILIKKITEDKNDPLIDKNKYSISPKVYNKNNNKKHRTLYIDNNIFNNKTKKIKKFLYLNHNINSFKINDKKKSMSERYLENHKKGLNHNNHKKMDLFKINKINSINNININVNNINNLNNKIEYNEIMKKIKSCSNDKKFLKRLNFDQPRKRNETFSSNKTLLNNHKELKEKNNHNKNCIYKINYTLNSNSNKNIQENSTLVNKQKVYEINSQKMDPLILTPRNNPGNIIIKGENKILYSPNANSGELKLRNKNKTKNTISENDKGAQKSYNIPLQININKTNNKKDSLNSSKKKDNYVNTGDNIKRINIFVNDQDSKIGNGNKNINININNFDKKIITNDSLTILNSSNSEFPSYIDSNDITQIESEKDEKNNVLTSYQLNLYLNEAKKSNPKHININNITNKQTNKALLYIQNSNKFHTNIDNINNKKTVDINKKDTNLNERNYENKSNRYDYSSRTYHAMQQKLKLNNILFMSINMNFKLLLLDFLDKKSLITLSSLNKTFYENFRKKIYDYFYEKIIKNNGNKNYILKILNTIPKYATNNFKNLKLQYEYYKNNKSLYNEIILQDISRTFPNDPSFKIDSINYKKLYNLLISYSNYNKNIGYAQGLNFLAASCIYLFKNEEKLFIFLDGIINRFELNNLLCINNQKLPKKLKYFSKILNKFCPEFVNHLSSKFVNHEFFTTGWLLTLFSNSMERNKLFICWCFMVIFGWKFFYSFVIQLILFYKDILLKINESKLSIKMKGILKGKQFIKDFNEIVKKTLTFMSNNIAL